ncbi:MAG: metallophosphoesterase [bacterium]|nr:metallophosphoesterase [bacterium]
MIKRIILPLCAFIFMNLWSSNAKFIVFSDPHTYDTVLGTSGKAFEDYLDSDRKLLRESSRIIDKLISLIDTIECDFILIPGDLTKDGEVLSHTLFNSKLDSLKKLGKKIFVTCGNHDIENPDAETFFGESKDPTFTVTKEDFEEIYFDFGFGRAESKDLSSLSYSAKAADDLYIIALDGCRYEENQKEKHPLTSGKLKKSTLKWLDSELERISEEKCEAIVMIHHGVVEHFKGQKKGYSEYVLENNKELKKILSKHNVQLVFTGHFHANDIALEKIGGTYIFDIETGSLVTHPCPFRIVSISDSFVNIETRYIEELDGIADFYSYKKSYIETGIKNIATEKISGFNVNAGDTEKLAEKVSYSFLSHYQGDEVYPEGFLDMDGFSFKARLVAFFQRDLFRGLLFDYTPDNNVIINLNSGEIKKTDF